MQNAMQLQRKECRTSIHPLEMRRSVLNLALRPEQNSERMCKSQLHCEEDFVGGALSPAYTATKCSPVLRELRQGVHPLCVTLAAKF